jgi:PKD repeat protein
MSRLSAAGLVLLTLVGCGGDGGGPSNPAPVAKFSINCNLLACTFTDASTDDGSVDEWSWNFGESGSGSNTSTAQSPAHTYAAAGTYHVQLTVTDNQGATSAVADSTITVSTTAANVPPTAAFTSSCISLDCQFTDGSTDSDGSITAWAWDFGDGSNDNNQSTQHSYSVTAPDTFTVRLIVTDDAGGKDTTTHNVVVAPPADCSGAACDLTLQADAHVRVTLTSVGCTAAGNTLRITAPNATPTPVDTTLFTDGCNTPEGTSFDIVGGVANVFASGTTIVPEVTSGSNDLAFPPTLRLQTGSGSPTWILEFDDGEGCGAADPSCGGQEPDFDDLVITIEAIP